MTLWEKVHWQNIQLKVNYRKEDLKYVGVNHMKIRIEHIEDDEKEVIIRCKEIDNYVLEIK